MPASRSSCSSPCGACKFLRRRCVSRCIFAPFFPPDQPQQFVKVQEVYGASNLSKILMDLPQESRQDAVNSLTFEAYARLNDPVHGCLGAISDTEERITALTTENEILIEKIKALMEKGIQMPDTDLETPLENYESVMTTYDGSSFGEQHLEIQLQFAKLAYHVFL